MIYPVLTYSRDLGDFPHDLAALHARGLKAVRLIYKGKSEIAFNQRIQEVQDKIKAEKLNLDVLIDLPGKKPIAGNLQQGLQVKSGMEYQLVDQGSEWPFPVIPTVNFFDHAHFPALSPGDIISIADDELNLLVKEVKETVVSCEALNAFYLTSNRSMGVKNNPFPVEANSEADVLFVQNLKDVPRNVKLLVSFTKKADDLLKLKALQPGIEVIPKIETLLDDTALLEILDCCETMMLGRGDLSLVCKSNELFQFQRHVIDVCQKNKKELIIGTGLLTGISDTQPPTISEVMDYGYLRSRGMEAFLIAGSNAHTHPMKTLEFMQEFEA